VTFQEIEEGEGAAVVEQELGGAAGGEGAAPRLQEPLVHLPQDAPRQKLEALQPRVRCTPHTPQPTPKTPTPNTTNTTITKYSKKRK